MTIRRTAGGVGAVQHAPQEMPNLEDPSLRISRPKCDPKADMHVQFCIEVLIHIPGED
jgi:hypothetical protein